jgi:DNA-binding XRE family transcriptional regulator
MTKEKLNSFWNSFSESDKQKIDARYLELRAEYITLQNLRKAHDLTQERMAEMLGVRQENISKLEKRSDMMLSTLRSYIQAMGGDLKLMVEFPNCKSVALSGFSGLGQEL